MMDSVTQGGKWHTMTRCQSKTTYKSGRELIFAYQIQQFQADTLPKTAAITHTFAYAQATDNSLRYYPRRGDLEWLFPVRGLSTLAVFRRIDI